MYSTGIFKIAEHQITFKNYDEPIYLIPFGDIHRHAPLCAVNHWLEYLEWAKKKKNCYFLGMGDYDDLASSSERVMLNSKSLHESTIMTLEDLYLKQTLALCREIKFMEGKLIGLLEGNHYGEFSNGTTTTQKMCEILKCKYLGVNGFIRLSFVNQARNTKSNSMDIWAHHGKGAARTVGGSMNRVEQMAENAEADIFLMGHDHKKSVGFLRKLRLSGQKDLIVKERKIMIGRTGSFLKGYVDGQKSYVTDMALKPCDLGVIKIELTPRRIREKGVDHTFIDIHASI